MRGVLKAGVGFEQALEVALAADTVSTRVVEVVDNGVVLVAFVPTVPVNEWLTGRGSGHAVVHAYHH